METPSTIVIEPADSPQGERLVLLALIVVSRCYLSFLLGCVLWTSAPALLGWHATIVSSGSMEPRLPIGSVLLAAPTSPNSLLVGNVVLIHDPAASGRLLSHRVVGRNAEGDLLTRGDANMRDDSTPAPTSSLIGVGRLLVPYAGYPTLWLRSHRPAPVAGWMLVTSSAAGLVMWDRAKHRQRKRDFNKGKRAQAVAASVALFVPVTLIAHEHSAGRSMFPASTSAAFVASSANPSDSWALSPSAQFGAGAYAATIAADSPLLFWKLNQNPATGVAADSSTSTTNTGSFSAAGVTGGQAGPFVRETSASVLFNGTSGCVRGNTTANLTALSIEAWFKTTTTVGGKIVGYGNLNTSANSGSYDRHIYMTNTGTLVWGVYTGATQTVTTTTSYNDGQWHHVVGTVGAGTSQSLYVDGSLSGTPIANTGVQNYAGYLHVGCDNLNGWPTIPTSFFFAGNIADVAVYSSVLTAAKVTTHYFAG